MPTTLLTDNNLSGLRFDHLFFLLVTLYYLGTKVDCHIKLKTLLILKENILIKLNRFIMKIFTSFFFQQTSPKYFMNMNKKLLSN